MKRKNPTLDVQEVKHYLQRIIDRLPKRKKIALVRFWELVFESTSCRPPSN